MELEDVVNGVEPSPQAGAAAAGSRHPRPRCPLPHIATVPDPPSLMRKLLRPPPLCHSAHHPLPFGMVVPLRRRRRQRRREGPVMMVVMVMTASTDRPSVRGPVYIQKLLRS